MSCWRNFFSCILFHSIKIKTCELYLISTALCLYGSAADPSLCGCVSGKALSHFPCEAGHWTNVREGKSLPERAANNKKKIILRGTEDTGKWNYVWKAIYGKQQQEEGPAVPHPPVTGTLSSSTVGFVCKGLFQLNQMTRGSKWQSSFCSSRNVLRRCKAERSNISCVEIKQQEKLCCL